MYQRAMSINQTLLLTAIRPQVLKVNVYKSLDTKYYVNHYWCVMM